MTEEFSADLLEAFDKKLAHMDAEEFAEILNWFDYGLIKFGATNIYAITACYAENERKESCEKK